MSVSFFSMHGAAYPTFSEDGGPDRTRTYDPRLIKAVL